MFVCVCLRNRNVRLIKGGAKKLQIARNIHFFLSSNWENLGFTPLLNCVCVFCFSSFFECFFFRMKMFKELSFWFGCYALFKYFYGFFVFKFYLKAFLPGNLQTARFQNVQLFIITTLTENNS